MRTNMGYKYKFFNGQKVFDHRKIAEEKIGRPLRADEVVHHLDGNKLNNSPENIVVLTRSDHLRVHNMHNAVLQVTDDGSSIVAPNITQCRICGCYFAHYDASIDVCDDCRSDRIQQRCIKHENDNTSKCVYCGAPIPKNKYKYCSQNCAHKDTYRCVHPTKDELQRLIWNIPTSVLAKQYGVSDTAITKWCKRYNISKPPRGYWSKKISENE